MIFVDGIGIGEFDRAKNPFARFPSPYFPKFADSKKTRSLPSAGRVIATDASMGIKGLPQSATGQTALLTGTNSAKRLGRHLPGFPTLTLQKILSNDSIFLKLEKSGKTATFANAFTQEYFERSTRTISATTWSVKASSFPFRMIRPELVRDEAISHDLTNHFLNKMGFEVPIRTPEKSADILVRIAEAVDFCLFEYFLTDRIGHAQDMNQAEHEIDKLTRFLDRTLQSLNLADNTVLLTSDHGNFEDLSVATHTTNQVPTMIWGRHRHFFASRIKKIEDVSPAIFDSLQNGSRTVEARSPLSS